MSTITNLPSMTPPPNPPPASSLQVSDLQALLSIIDLAAQRGAFRANELSAIGQAFDKVSKFLESTVPPLVDAPAEMSAPMTAMMPVSPMAPPFTPKLGDS